MASRHWALALLVHVFQLLLAVTIGLQVYQVIEASIGHSTSVEAIIDGYDHTIMRDLINVHGASLSPLLGQLRWFILIYIVFSVFIHGGVLNTLLSDRRQWSDFWLGGAQNFRTFFWIAVISLVLFIIWSALLWIPFMINLFPMIEGMDRERPIFWLLLAVAIIWLFGITMIFALSFYARLDHIRSRKGVWANIRKGWSQTRRSFIVTSLILLGFFLLVIALYTIHFTLEGQIGLRSETLIISFVIIQQIIIYAKVWIRFAMYGSLIAISPFEVQVPETTSRN